MEQEIRRVGHSETARREVGRSWAAGDRLASGQHSLNILASIDAADLRGRRRSGPGRGHAGEPGGVLDQRVARETGPVRKRAQGAAAVTGLEIDPVTGVLTLERNDA